jgi:hypothetical protein
MSKDDRDVLEVLKAELDFIEKGGYGRSVRTPWLPTTAFQDAPSCVCFPFHTHQSGETVAALEGRGDQQELEDALKTWLRATIEKIEEERAGQFVV